MVLRPPNYNELPMLSALCLRSKAVWAYSDGMLDAFRQELTLTDADLAEDAIMLAEDRRGIAGVVHISQDGSECHLEKLFIDPARFGEGTGHMLYVWATRTAQKTGAYEMIIDSDPNAAPFYVRMGAVADGKAESRSIPGRFLLRLVHRLQDRPRI